MNQTELISRRQLLRRMGLCAALPVLCPSLIANAKAEGTAFLFCHFHGNGESGLHFAASRDGYKWTPVRRDASFLKPELGDKIMRDPSIYQGPDGLFHLVWTTGWWNKGFGYASSKDLITWSKQQYVPVNEPIMGAKNTWAPDIFYDREMAQYLIVWATTIPGKFPETDKDGDHNHRLYCTTTKDFQNFTATRLFYDPGFNCIDGTIIPFDGRYILVFKDERTQQKRLRLATSDKAEGPYGAPTDPFGGDWVEGPSVLRIGNEYLIYFDHYRAPHYYGALSTRDFKTFRDVTAQIAFPRGVRHGTAFTVSEKLLQALEG